MKIEKTIELYDFTEEETRCFKGISGIYGLIYENEVIYVGQSKNLQQRLNNHRNSDYQIKATIKKIKEEEGRINRTKQLAMYYFIEEHKKDMKFIILKETEDRNKYEEHYISLFQPKFNYKGVDIPY